MAGSNYLGISKSSEVGVTKALPWTEAHAREAQARTLELAAEHVRAGNHCPASASVADESRFRMWMMTCLGFDPARAFAEAWKVHFVVNSAQERESGECWSAAHRQEAMARAYEIAAEVRRAHEAYDIKAANLVRDEHMADREGGWRGRLTSILTELPEAWTSDGYAAVMARIKHEARRIDDLAAGRRVRETVWRVRYFGDDGARGSVTVDLTHEEAVATRDRMRADGWRGVLVRVDRVRRSM